ncbi:hypothetical protein AALA22_08805 [Anaerovoracaceae bacterium 41-7]
MGNKAYDLICPKCGNEQTLNPSLPEPNMGAAYSGIVGKYVCVPYDESTPNENGPCCDFCGHKLISMDRTFEEYLDLQEELTGSSTGDIHAFIETTYLCEHAEDLKGIFSQEMRNKKLIWQAEKDREAELRRKQRYEEACMRARGVKRWSSNCPRCGSNEISTRRNGLSLLPNSFINVCQKCGKKWKPGK